MKRTIIVFLIFISTNVLYFQSWAQSNQNMKPLRTAIINELSNHKGKFAIAFKDLSTEKELLINAGETFHAASTMKTPVMIEVYQQVNEGKFSLNDSVEIKNLFKSIADGSEYSLDSANDSYSEIYHHIGEKSTLYDLVYQMIINSSNLATNMIIEKVDAKKVTQTMRDYGAKDIRVLRGVEDQKAYDRGMNNTTTAYDLMLIFEKIAKGEAVDKKSSDAMIQILLDQKHRDVIPARLPAEVKVAHKTGSITGVQHDSGIVLLPNGNKYVLVILSKNLEDEKAAVESMAKVSQMIYSSLTNGSSK